MKKLWIGALAMVLLLSLCGCGDGAQSDASATDGTTAVTTTTAAGVTTTPTDGTTTAPSDGDSQTTTQGQDTADTTEVPATTTAKVPTTTTAKVPTTTTTKVPPTTTDPKPPVTTTTTRPAEDPAPAIVLPALGTDVDVVNQKDRIHVTAATAVFDDDGAITVTLTFTNSSTKWITQESNYVCYTAYDKDGDVLESNVKIYIGVIDTKKHPTKSFTFTVPADTAELRLTNSSIVYWTEWS